MARALGSSATLYASSDNITYTQVHSVDSVEIPAAVKAVDITDNDSNGTKEYLPGDSTYSLSVSLHYDVSDAGQTLVLNNAFAKTLTYFRYRPRGDVSGQKQYQAAAYLTSFTTPSKHEAVQMFTIKGDITAGVTVNTVP